VSGEVFDYAVDEQGIWRYLVQLSGYAAMSAADPKSWFQVSELRAT